MTKLSDPHAAPNPVPSSDPVPPAVKEPPNEDPQERTPNAPVDEPDPVVPKHV